MPEREAVRVRARRPGICRHLAVGRGCWGDVDAALNRLSSTWRRYSGRRIHGIDVSRISISASARASSTVLASWNAMDVANCSSPSIAAGIFTLLGMGTPIDLFASLSAVALKNRVHPTKPCAMQIAISLRSALTPLPRSSIDPTNLALRDLIATPFPAKNLEAAWRAFAFFLAGPED